MMAVVAASALTLSLTACGGESSNSGNADGGANGGTNYITARGSEPQNPLIPGNTNEEGGGNIIDLLYSGLVYYDAEGEIHNEMAESIELEGDTTYVVKLRDDVTWADGSPVTSKDFVNTWNTVVRESLLGASFFDSIKGFEEGKDLEGLEIVDDQTFKIELTQPEADFPTRLGYSAFYPMHASAFDDLDAYGENPLGNGPYKLKEWNHNQDATVIPNAEYDGHRTPKNDGVTFVFYAQQDAAYADLLAGNLDVTDAVPDSALTTYETELGDRAVNQPAAIIQAIDLPERNEHFSGEEGKLRRAAISRAINRKEITDTIFQGTRTPATDFTSPVIPGHSDSLKGAEVLEYNPEEAKKLWAAADELSPWSGELTISYNGDGDHQAWIDAVANSIKNTLDIEVVGNAYPDFKSLRDDVTNKTIEGAYRTGWKADYPSLGNFLAPLYGTGGGSNDADYSNPAFDELLKKAANAQDLEAATPIYNEAQEILLTDLPSFPLWYANVSGGYSDKVDDVVYSWNGVPLFYNITKK